ncbi:MAG: hypothetical protein RLZ18_1196 [Actinomycetota bacterium]
MACKRSGVQFPSAPPLENAVSSRVKATVAAVTVVMRTFERPVMLARAIASVLNQTFSDWELVVVNNGGDPAPVDAAVAVGRQANPTANIRVLHLDDRCGMEEASNRALAGCQSEFFVIHDDDDSWREGFLARTVEVAHKNGSAAAVVSGVTKIQETYRGGKVWPVAYENFYLDEGRLTYRGMIGNNTFPPIAALFRTRLLSDVGMFDASLPVLGDWEFNLRAVNAGGFVFLNERLANYHTRTADSDRAAGNSITIGEDLHRDVKLRLQDRWLAEPAVNGVNKGVLSISAQVLLDIDEVRRHGVQGNTGAPQDGDYIAHRTAEIIALRKPLRRIARSLRHPAHGARAVKRLLRRVLGK